jgi:SAM-dependent methyltransferase
MRRRQLIEIEDLPWCPRSVRDGGTDWLGFMANGTRAFNAVAPKIREAMTATGTSNVLDLCSGGGGPWLTLERELARTGPVRVELTDLYPNVGAFAAIRDRSGGQVAFRPGPIDATDVPAELDGVRTMFNCFHHFPPDGARAILSDAVRKRRAIAIFEAVDRRALPMMLMPVQVAAMFLMTPFVRPFRLSRLFYTYVVPLIPGLVLFDGTMSMLRVYLAEELAELVRTVPGSDTFDWDIGTTPIGPLPVRLTHIVGVPRPSAS